MKKLIMSTEEVFNIIIDTMMRSLPEKEEEIEEIASSMGDMERRAFLAVMEVDIDLLSHSKYFTDENRAEYYYQVMLETVAGQYILLSNKTSLYKLGEFVYERTNNHEGWLFGNCMTLPIVGRSDPNRKIKFSSIGKYHLEDGTVEPTTFGYLIRQEDLDAMALENGEYIASL